MNQSGGGGKRMRVLTCSVFVLATAVVSGGAATEGGNPSDPLAIVSEAYAKIEGFVVSYHSEGENKSLDATIGLDKKSGLAMFEVFAVKDGRKMDGRGWSTRSGRIYFSGGRDLYSVDLMVALRRFVTDLKQIAEVGDTSFLDLTCLPTFYLEKGGIGSGLGFSSNRDQSPWQGLIKGATVRTSDDKCLVVTSEMWGELSFDAKSGVLVRQEIKGATGENRVLELKELRLNPGSDGVGKLSEGWNTDGANPAPTSALLAQARPLIFRSFVDFVDSGTMEEAELEELFVKKREALKALLEELVDERENPLKNEFWKRLLDQGRDKVKAQIKAKLPAGKVWNENEIDSLLRDERFRKPFRDTIVNGLMENEDIWRKSVRGFLKSADKEDAEPKTAQGKAAEEFVERYVARTVLEIGLDRKMNENWGKVKKPPVATPGEMADP